MSKTEITSKVEWRQINWRKVEYAVFKLQKRIYQASQRGDVKTVRRLQKRLMRSYYSRVLAVRKVSQDNQGKKTAGVDGIKSLAPKERLTLATKLKLSGKSKPTRRVWIPKPGTNEKRPLGIPTMHDRALQALVKLALEPEWEARFEENSYGFRPGRSAQDAIDAIFKQTCRKAKWVLDADIAKCFDRIDHQALLNKLNTFPTMKRQIKAWLKSGVMDTGVFEETDKGTPQGGVISPLLANIALHGLEEYINSRGDKAACIRYADDFVIFHENKNMIENKIIPLIQRWLSQLGLELKPSKTRVCHTSEGFEFLGFNVRQYKVGAYKAAKIKTHGKTINLGFNVFITPSKEATKQHLQQLKEVIKAHHGASQAALIGKLNPIIRGWCNYYSSVVASETYTHCDNQMWFKLWRWGKAKCSGESAKRVKSKYWRKLGNDNWAFATHKGYKLIKHASTPIRRHTKVQGERSPFDGDNIYWSQRLANYPGMPLRVKNLLKAQGGKCTVCKTNFKQGDITEVDHQIPLSLGGKNVYSNLQLLHRHCHDKKTAKDGSLKQKRSTHNKG